MNTKNNEQLINKRHEKCLEILKDLRPIDDDFMRAMFKDNIKLVEFVLRIVLNKEDLIITKSETQYDCKRITGARSICLDVLALDKQGNKYNVEIQRSDFKASPKRVRYYASSLDIESLDVSNDFEKLIDINVIFILENDVFNKGKPYYSFNRIDSTNNILLNDGSNILYVNGKYNNKDDKLGRLMHDFNCNKADDMYYDIMKETTRYLKETEEGVKQMCKLMEELIKEERAEERVVVQKETTNNLMNLVQKLISLGRIEDIERITTDSIYREQLIKEFSLI